jgi:hypothetical protein
MGITIYTTGADIDAMISVMEQFKIAYIMLMIVGFYFGGGFAEGIVQKVRK